MLVLCWPICAMIMMIAFLLGCCIGGRLWQRPYVDHKRDQRQRTGSREEKIEIDVAPEIVKTGFKHKENLAAKEVVKRYDKGGSLYLSKSCTKVHFIRDCPGLNSADHSQIRTIPICLHCLNHQRKAMKFDRED